MKFHDINIYQTCVKCNLPTTNPFMYLDRIPTCSVCWWHKCVPKNTDKYVDENTFLLITRIYSIMGDDFMRAVKTFDNVSVRFNNESDKRSWYFWWTGITDYRNVVHKSWISIQTRNNISWEEFLELVCKFYTGDKYRKKERKYSSSWFIPNDDNYIAWFKERHWAIMNRYNKWNTSAAISDMIWDIEMELELSCWDIVDVLNWWWDEESRKSVINYAKNNWLMSRSIKILNHNK